MGVFCERLLDGYCRVRCRLSNVAVSYQDCATSDNQVRACVGESANQVRDPRHDRCDVVCGDRVGIQEVFLGW